MQATIASPAGLIKMALNAEEKKFNRQIKWEELKKVMDPEGVCVERMRMIHEHAGGDPVEPHYRTMWYVPIKGQDVPTSVTIDCEMDVHKEHTSKTTYNDN